MDKEFTFSHRLWFGPRNYRYSSSFKDEYKTELRRWCEENCEGLYAIGSNFLEFQLEEDFALATLTHSN